MSMPRALADAWRQARRVVVLTGAGLSTASGIPDFRSPGGRWKRYQPVPLPEFLASERAREAYWRYKGETWQLICAAEPNAAHAALADLARALDAAAACDLFVAAGTSLVVGPVNQMFPVAREAGARTAILTASETPYDTAADVRIAAPVEQVLPAVRDQIR